MSLTQCLLEKLPRLEVCGTFDMSASPQSVYDPQVSLSISVAYNLLMNQGNPRAFYYQRKRYLEMMQLTDTHTGLSYSQLLFRLRLRYPTGDAASLAATDYGRILNAAFGTPLPLCNSNGDFKYTLHHVMPCMDHYPHHTPQVSGQIAWLSDDSLLTVMSMLDLQTLSMMPHVCQHWLDLCGDFSPLWTHLQQQFMQNCNMDTRKDFLKAIQSSQLTPRQRFDRTLFVWLSKNPSASPLGAAGVHRVLTSMASRDTICSSMMTRTTQSKLYGPHLFPPDRFIAVM